MSEPVRDAAMWAAINDGSMMFDILEEAGLGGRELEMVSWVYEMWSDLQAAARDARNAMSQAHERAHLRPVPGCGTCRRSATQALYNGVNAIQGYYCDRHARAALNEFKAEMANQPPSS